MDKLGFELRAYTLSVATPAALFCHGLFRDKISLTICLGWLRPSNLDPSDLSLLSS
jgi:hypothetical protein